MRKTISFLFLSVCLLATWPTAAQARNGFGNPLAAMVSVTFPDSSFTFQPTQSQIALLGDFLGASMVTISGRTSTNKPSTTDEILAFQRAASARAWLITRGVSPLTIFINFASAADYAVDNSTPEGRQQNQRVDVEVFYVQPFDSSFSERSQRTQSAQLNKKESFSY